MATVTHRLNDAGSGNVASYTTVSFTPPAVELLVVGVGASGQIDAAPTLTSSVGIGFTLVELIDNAGSTLYIFVAQALTTGAAMTLTFTAATAGTGFILHAAGISDMTKLSSTAVKQKAEASGAASTTPAATFAAACLTANPTVVYCYNTTQPAGLTPPTSWTEMADTGHVLPNRGLESALRDSGFTGTTVTWGGTSATAHGEIIVELDTSAVAAADSGDFFYFF